MKTKNLFSRVSMSSNIIQLILLIATLGKFALALPSYCDMTCSRGKHTVCKRLDKCGPVKPCSSIDSTAAFRAYMVQAHNQVRNDIASGKTKGSYGNTGAKDMNAVSYDMELEYIAACWNNACHRLQHDECRNAKRWSVGQNIWWGSGVNGTTKAVPDWFGEIEFYTDATWLLSFDSSKYPNDGKMRGHFTQVIWGKTKYIGCSLISNSDDSSTQLICNYGPTGNMQGAPIYKMAKDAAEIASECEGGIKNTEFTSLCGKVEPTPTDPMWTKGQEAGPSGSETSQCISIPFLIFICVFSVFRYYSL